MRRININTTHIAIIIFAVTITKSKSPPSRHYLIRIIPQRGGSTRNRVDRVHNIPSFNAGYKSCRILSKS